MHELILTKDYPKVNEVVKALSDVEGVVITELKGCKTTFTAKELVENMQEHIIIGQAEWEIIRAKIQDYDRVVGILKELTEVMNKYSI